MRATCQLALWFAGYAYGGVLYQWYFWPSNLFGSLFPLALIVLMIDPHRRMTSVWRVAVFLLVLAGLLAQGAFSFAWGKKEFSYRGGIGVWLAEHASSSDRRSERQGTFPTIPDYILMMRWAW